MLRLAGVSASARPFVIRGIAFATPPVPVLVPAPAPVRLNHSSRVKFVTPRAGAAPNVTYWLVPLSWSPKFGASATKPATHVGPFASVPATLAVPNVLLAI